MMKAGTSVLLIACLTLSGCLGLTGGGGSNGASVPVRSTIAPGDFRDALCDGAPDVALARLPARAGDDPTMQLYAAYALEQSGHGMRARPHFERLAERGISDRVKLSCGNQTILEGSLSAVAAERVIAINMMLRELDADLSVSDRLHRGLPAITITADSQTNASPSQSGRRLRVGGNRGPGRQTDNRPAPVTGLSTPSSLDPLGRWFVHLASYSASENASVGRQELARQYPSFAGFFDSWQIDVAGRRTWRIGVRVSDRGEADALCLQLESYGRYCAVLDANSRLGG